MSASDATCGTTDGATCWTVPAEFVRLRYFFGQRLGVIDLTDEQGYLIGKQRFHNLRAHGAGVLCGLRAERYLFPAGATDTTVLLVRRGAALDGCGREVIVGWDQCIDVAAWFRQNKVAKGISGWNNADPAPGEQVLYVCLRYRECPSDPAPAPRDPCGCETTGCDFARVREGFELSLMTQAEVDAAACLTRTLPAGADPTPPIESPTFDVSAHFHRVLAGDCPDPTAEPCLCLSSFQVEVTGTEVTDVRQPDNAIAQRLSLLSTAMLQETLGQAMVASANEAVLGPGPRIRQFRFEGTTSAANLFLDVTLVQDGGVDSPLAPIPPASPLPPAAFVTKLLRFRADAEGTWETVTLGSASWVPASKWFLVPVTGALVADGLYRFEWSVNPTAPLVDMRMRTLSPLKLARHFRLIAGSGTTLLMAPTLFDT